VFMPASHPLLVPAVRPGKSGWRLEEARAGVSGARITPDWHLARAWPRHEPGDGVQRPKTVARPTQCR
jgi:hypothetical protein